MRYKWNRSRSDILRQLGAIPQILKHEYVCQPNALFNRSIAHGHNSD